ncbi:hypothetical protein LJC47_03480 [Desulfosarcina sp. OttesenSCG-928-B08]|nr:hypothetical protein [Desulfosarcina sp. OttesenSCG-928-B08]
MVEAQTRMDTPLLMALMVMAALVGYGVDFIVYRMGRRLVRWRELA